MNMLMAADVAREFHRSNGWLRFDSARQLVDAIDKFMAEWGLAKSTINRLDVADHVIRLQALPVVTEAEAAAHQAELREGWGDELAMRQLG
jgi:hypothetical protein